MRILIDTNIVIEREDNHVISDELQDLLQIFNKERIKLLIHPKTRQEILRDGNVERQQKVYSKLKTYPVLESPPEPSREFIAEIGTNKTHNDEVDNSLLFCLQKNAVDFLITEDKGIHRKARIVGLEDRVFRIDDALQHFGTLFKPPKIPAMPSIIHEPVYKLEVSDPIFDHLKKSYPEFEKWFAKISRDGRKAFFYKKIDGKLGAICIYKFESQAINDFVPNLPAKERLKISTLRVTHTGFKIGELLIKLAISLSMAKGNSELYLTHFIEPDDYLVDLIEEYGFIRIAENARGESLFLKRISPDDTEIPLIFSANAIYQFNRRFFPSFYDGLNVQKYLIPIQPQFHERLFPEKRTIKTLDEFIGQIKSEGNTIKKAYICHAQIKKIQPNDLLLFYRSQKIPAITAIGTVDQAFVGLTDPGQILNRIAKRTVYSIDEIREISLAPTLVILFRLNFFFKRPVSLEQLRNLKITIPQTIISLNQKNYIEIKTLGGIDEHFTFD